MKNLLSLLAALGLTATAATTVIACGSPKNSVVIKKTALKDLNLKTRLKNSVKNQQAAFDSFIEMNPEVSDLHDSVQVIAFDVPDYNKEGSLEVEAKTNTKYSGTLTITIPELNKTDITGLVTNTTIQGTENMTEAQAFQAFLEANNSWTNLNDYVEVDSFTAATYTSNGSLTIKAKTNTAYTGSVMVRINAIGQTSLIDLHLKTLLSTSVTDQQAAFDLFIKMNPEVSDLSDDVQIVGFTAPDYNQTGSLEVEAKPSTNYSGTLTITIPELNKTDITGLVTNTTIQGTENMTVDQAFQAFLEAN
ncbi:lipoprotein, partial [Mesoplasma whartonense]